MWEETGDIWDFDSCDGHTSTGGVYHYHFGSDCLKNVSVNVRNSKKSKIKAFIICSGSNSKAFCRNMVNIVGTGCQKLLVENG